MNMSKMQLDHVCAILGGTINGVMHRDDMLGSGPKEQEGEIWLLLR